MTDSTVVHSFFFRLPLNKQLLLIQVTMFEIPNVLFNYNQKPLDACLELGCECSVLYAPERNE